MGVWENVQHIWKIIFLIKIHEIFYFHGVNFFFNILEIVHNFCISSRIKNFFLIIQYFNVFTLFQNLGTPNLSVILTDLHLLLRLMIRLKIETNSCL